MKNAQVKAQAQVNVIDFELNGIKYTTTRPNYYYKKVDGKQVRIPKAEFDEAWEQAGMTEKQAREEKQAKSDKQAEQAVNKEKKQSKPRKSKDIAYDGNGITLTAKQVDFFHHIPDTCFYENGLESSMWCDVLADEIGGQFADKPMTVGAMISTLREKDLIYVAKDHINGRTAKWFGFTELGKKVAKDLGLE